MRRIWLGMAVAALLAAAPCASGQDMNAALQAFNCGTPAPPPTPPDGAHARMSDMQNFAAQANAWQTSQQAIERCLVEATNAMDHGTSARVADYNQRVVKNDQATAAWQTATGAPSAHH